MLEKHQIATLSGLLELSSGSGLSSGGVHLLLNKPSQILKNLEKVLMVDHLGTWAVVSVAEFLADIEKQVSLIVPTGSLDGK